MQIDEKKIGNVMVVELLSERLDARVSANFKNQMLEIINRGNNSIVIALDRVEFVDSSGLGAIISSLKTMGSNGEMVISGPKNTVRSLFKLTRMDKVFKIYENTNDAVHALE